MAHASEAQKAFVKERFATSEANRRVRELAATGETIEPHLWTGITQVRPGAGIAVVGDPEQCAETLQNFIDLGCHSFCLSGYLHDEEARALRQMGDAHPARAQSRAHARRLMRQAPGCDRKLHNDADGAPLFGVDLPPGMLKYKCA